MAKQKPDVKIESCGLYTPLEKEGKELPKLVRFTDEIPCELGVEFGYILHIRKGRGMKLTFQIDHPPFTDDEGNVPRPSPARNTCVPMIGSFFSATPPGSRSKIKPGRGAFAAGSMASSSPTAPSH